VAGSIFEVGSFWLTRDNVTGLLAKLGSSHQCSDSGASAELKRGRFHDKHVTLSGPTPNANFFKANNHRYALG
jgi:hypothetical protein